MALVMAPAEVLATDMMSEFARGSCDGSWGDHCDESEVGN